MVMTASIDSFAHNADISVFHEKRHHYEYQDPHPLKSGGVASAKQLIGDALSKKIGQICHDECEPGEEDTFYVADLGEVFRQHVRWRQNLPRVRPFFGTPLCLLSLFTKLTLRSRQVEPGHRGAPSARQSRRWLRLRLQDGD